MGDNRIKYFYAQDFSSADLQECGFSDIQASRFDDVSDFILRIFKADKGGLRLLDNYEDTIKVIEITFEDAILGEKKIKMELYMMKRVKSDVLMEHIHDLQEQDRMLITGLLHSNAFNVNGSIILSKEFNMELNILTKENQDKFTFTGYPGTSASPKIIADITSTSGYSTKADRNGIAYIEIDLNTTHYVAHYAVNGQNGYKPKTEFYLRGSTDGKEWNVLSTDEADNWTASMDGIYHRTYTYSFRNVRKVDNPGYYRYYQIYANGFTNNQMMVTNVGLWVPWKDAISIK